MTRGSERPLEQLQQAEQLMAEGKVDAACPLIDALEGVDSLPPDAQLTWQLLKSQLLITRGEWEASRQLAKAVLQASQERGKPLHAVDASIVLAETLGRLEKYEESLEAIVWGEELLATLSGEQSAALNRRQASLIHFRGRLCFLQGDLNQALEHFQQSLGMRQALGLKHDIAVSVLNIGAVHSSNSNFDLALEYTQQALNSFQEIGNKFRSAWCLANIGYVYYFKGDLEQGLKAFQQRQALCEKIGNRMCIAVSQYFICAIFRLKGDLDRAMKCIEQALPIFEEVGTKNWIAEALRERGQIYQQRGSLKQALAQFEQSLALFKELGANYDIVRTLCDLVSVALDQGALSQAQHYLQRLQQVSNHVKNKKVSQQARLAEALVLKASPRIRDKARAQEIFQQVTKEEIVVYWLTEFAMLHLCELLLDELKAYGNPKVFQEAKALVHRLYELAQTHYSFWLVVDALILQAKFALIEGNFAAASNFLDQGLLTAEEKGFQLLADKVSAERRHLNEQYETWLHIIQSNAPFQERLAHTRLIEYIKAAQKVVDIGFGNER
ncbi:MAG: tetratricopeptide repeat protein [Candidatus Hodarchaeota archaeon]